MIPRGARVITLPPPIGGWNTRDTFADMDLKYAPILDNWFPDTDRCTVRKGSSDHATGMSGAVETILEYTALTGSNKIYAANSGKIYDVTGSGAVGAAVVSGMSNNKWQQVQIGTSGGQFLLAFNGADTPRTFNGTSWSTYAGTGPTAANLIWCNLHQRRLWMGEKSSLSAWYLAVNAITGAATEFPMHGIAQKGGYIMSMGTWTRDAGDGQDDVAVFVTSEGEAIVYAGTDPSSAATWALVGVFQVGRPIGRRCLIKAGGDLIIATEFGFLPLSAAMLKDKSQIELIALSYNIQKQVNSAVKSQASTFGWQPFVYPLGTQIMFNVPQANSLYHQYVFNTITGAPCRYTGMDAICWGLKGDTAFFGTSTGTVVQFDSGKTDSGASVEFDGLQAFSYLKSPSMDKIYKLAEIVLQSDGAPSYGVDINTDFQIRRISGVVTKAVATSALWGISKWGINKWGSADQVYRAWRGVRGTGRSAAVRVHGSTVSGRPSWLASNLAYLPGGQL